MTRTTLEETVDRVLAQAKTAEAPRFPSSTATRLRKLAQALRTAETPEATFNDLYRVKEALYGRSHG